MFGCWIIWHCQDELYEGWTIGEQIYVALPFDPRNHTKLDHWYFDTPKYLGAAWNI